MKTLAEINAILGTETAADLTQLIGAIKAAVRESGEGVIADLEAKLASDAAAAVDAAKALAESNASELAKLTASHAEAIAAKDAQLATQVEEAWNETKTVARKHSAAITELEAQHAADLAKADADLAAAVEAEGRAVHNRLDALVQAGQEAHAAGDLDALGKVLVSAYAHTSKARRAKLEADLAAAQSAVTAAADKLAAL
jgi:4-diphosphocytidyl-2C-methyl-D-erythritol kinase